MRNEPPPFDAATRGNRQMLPVPTAMPSIASIMAQRLVNSSGRLTSIPPTSEYEYVCVHVYEYGYGHRTSTRARKRARTRARARAPSALRHPLPHVVHDPPRVHALLRQRVPVPHGHRPIFERLAVDRDRERRPRLVLPPVAPPDRAAVVEERREPRRPQRLMDPLRHLRHAVLLHEREHRRLDRRQAWREREHDPRPRSEERRVA